MTVEAPISRLDLERFVLGRLEPTVRDDIDARVGTDPELRARIERLRAEIQVASVDLPAFQVPVDDAPTLEVVAGGTSNAQRRSISLSLIVGVGLAAAAATLLVVQPSEAPQSEVFRGDFDLAVEHVRAGSGSSVGLMVEARSGDTLQYTITPDTDGWWMVADIQDDGKISLWTPPQKVEAGLPARAAVQLDEYSGSERAFFLLSDAPMELDAVREAYAQAYRKPLADIDSLPGLPAKQRSILIVRAPTEP